MLKSDCHTNQEVVIFNFLGDPKGVHPKNYCLDNSAFNSLEVGGCVSKLGNCKYDEKKLLF